MKSIVAWAIRNSPGMNTLMVTVLLVGIASLGLLRREVFPEFELDIILVSVPYPGASPSEVEEGVCLKIEEAVRSIAGIKKQTTVAAEGAGSVILELEANQDDPQKILAEVRSAVDRIPSFPELAEDPEVKQITFRAPAIRVAVIGPETDDPEAEKKLRLVAEDVRAELLQLASLSQAELQGVRAFQIDIEIAEDTLRQYGLSLKNVADAVRRENLEMPGGKLISDSQQVLLRGKNKRVTGQEIASIPLVTDSNGVVLTIGDLGVVRDEFSDTAAINKVSVPQLGIQQRDGVVIGVDRTSDEDLLQISEDVREFVANYSMPSGYRLWTWRDESVNVRDRLELLSRNGLQGLVLVFLMLSLFLDLRLAFWVALGIPISVLGCCAVLLYTGQTLNMLSMFAFLMALGIVVDDAIVIGENIYAHRERGSDLIPAAIEGTVEVFPSVFASVATTIVAFAPLMFVSGIMGKFIAVMPVAVIAMLVISLIESLVILPCHLAHHDGAFLRSLSFLMYPLKPVGWLFGKMSEQTSRMLESFIQRIYVPTLSFSLRWPTLIMSLSAAVLLSAVGLVLAGITPFIVFPKVDSTIIEAKIIFPDGTPIAVSNDATSQIEQAILELDREYRENGQDVIRFVHRKVGDIATGGSGPNANKRGSHVGSVMVELVDTAERDDSSQEIVNAWRQRVLETCAFPGTDSLTFGSPAMGPGGTPIEFKLLAPSESAERLEQAVEKVKEKLATYPGVFDVADDSTPGKWEYQLQVKDSAQAMGVPLRELAETVRNAYFGSETMRLQRGRHEVKLMVRYPENERRTLAGFSNIRVRSADGMERPLTELASVTVDRSASEINRIEQLRSITVSADVQESQGNAFRTVGDLRQNFIPELQKEFPELKVRWEGQQEQTQESMFSLIRGFGVASLIMYFLLTIEFRSYIQPLIVMAIIPFGAIGAIGGHAVMQIPLTLFSVFGLVALTGVVVNDSIVLIDFINHRVAEGMSPRDAILEGGRRRFRPVLLTSLTTIAGMTPILLEQSLQAQILIPMATSLCFGLLLATVLVLFLAPTFYFLYTYWLEVFSGRSRATGVTRDQAPLGPAKPSSA